MAQLTLQQLKAFGIRPDTSLGQHFLLDDNILRVIDGLAELDAADVVYEPGPGVGVLTDYLAARVAHVHAVEIDRRLEPALVASVADHANVALHWGDATAISADTLTPVPNKLVSNLPYHVAGPIVAETLQRAPHVQLQCIMVQREVADRFFAAPGGSNYGALSVLVQATCEKLGTHKVSRSVFVPVPNVDSTLLAFRRSRDLLATDAVAGFARFVRGAFAHRRKTLANNLGAAGVARSDVPGLLDAAGVGARARPQELAPQQFVALYDVVRAWEAEQEPA